MEQLPAPVAPVAQPEESLAAVGEVQRSGLVHCVVLEGGAVNSSSEYSGRKVKAARRVSTFLR